MPTYLPRLQVNGYWGYSTQFARSHNMNARQCLTAAEGLKGGRKGARLYVPHGTDKKDVESDNRLFPVGPSFTRPVVDSNNQKSAWTTTATSANWEEVSGNFDGNTKSLFYINATANAAARFTKTTAIDANRPFFVRIGALDPMETQNRLSVAAMFGTVSSKTRWRLALEDTSCELYRLATTWNQSDQTALDALLNTTGGLSESQQASADTYRATLYAESWNINGALSTLGGAARTVEWTIIPEPIGFLWISCNGEWKRVALPDVLQTGTTGEIYGAGQLEVSTTGGAFSFQFGHPDFARSTTLILPSYLWEDTTLSVRADTSLTGTTCTVEEGTAATQDPFGSDLPPFVLVDGQPIDPGTPPNVPHIAMTSTGSYPAFFYELRGWIDATERTGGDVGEPYDWDSDDHLINGFSRIEEITPSHGGKLDPVEYSIKLLNDKGALATPGSAQQFLCNRLASIRLNGSLLGVGIIRRAFGNDYAKATPNVAQVQVTAPNTTLTLEVVSFWQILEEWLIREDVIFDGLRLGAAIRRLLRLCGTKNNQMGAVSASAGPLIEPAPLGAEPRERPEWDTTAAEAARHLMQRYGRGWMLFCDGGVWTLQVEPDTIQAHFKSGALASQTPPQYEILAPLDLVRDSGDTYNDFRVEGENGARTWRVQESISAPNWAGYQGRIRRAPTVRDEGYKTDAQLVAAARNEAREGGAPGRFFSFATRFVPGLRVGDYVLVEGVTCTVESINNGSIKAQDDGMALTCREHLPVA